MACAPCSRPVADRYSVGAQTPLQSSPSLRGIGGSAGSPPLVGPTPGSLSRPRHRAPARSTSSAVAFHGGVPDRTSSTARVRVLGLPCQAADGELNAREPRPFGRGSLVTSGWAGGGSAGAEGGDVEIGRAHV